MPEGLTRRERAEDRDVARHARQINCAATRRLPFARREDGAPSAMGVLVCPRFLLERSDVACPAQGRLPVVARTMAKVGRHQSWHEEAEMEEG